MKKDMDDNLIYVTKYINYDYHLTKEKSAILSLVLKTVIKITM